MMKKMMIFTVNVYYNNNQYIACCDDLNVKINGKILDFINIQANDFDSLTVKVRESISFYVYWECINIDYKIKFLWKN